MSESSHSARDDGHHVQQTPTPNRAPSAAESTFDTALPPISSQHPSMRAGTPQQRSELSMAMGNSRGMPRPSFQLAHDSMSSMAARNSAMHRRNGSTLKTVMKRIFSRNKRRSETNEFDEVDGLPFRDSQQHRTDSGSAGNSYIALSNSLNSKQNTPGRRPQDNAFPALTSEVLDRLSPMPPARRRMTLPSLVLSDDESRVALEESLHPDRPEQSRRGSPSVSSAQDDVRRRNMIRAKRTSRSAGSLRRMAREHHRMSPIQWRRRSAENNGWRSKSLQRASDGQLSMRRASEITVSTAKQSVTTTASEVESEQQSAVDSMPPNVGHLVNSMQDDDTLSLEQRLTTLEVKLIDLEFAIARMQGIRKEPSPVDMKPGVKKSPTPDNLTTRGNVREQSSGYLAAGGNERHRSSSEGDCDRPLSTLSTGTIRPYTNHRSRTLQTPSFTSLTDIHNSISIDQYSALVMLLRREQSARRNLEGQVSSLQEDMQHLYKLTSGSMGVGVGTRYPINSTDSQDLLRFRRTMERPPSDSPPRSDEKAGTPPYDSDSEWERSSPRGTSPDDVFGRGKLNRDEVGMI